jgi:hypothetical protein
VFLHMPPKQGKGSPQHEAPQGPSARHASPGIGGGACPPALALREPLGFARATGNPKEINIRPSDLLSQISLPTTAASADPQGMPPLIDLVEVNESDDEDDSIDDSSSDSSASDDESRDDESSSDDESDESSIDESDYRDILHQRQPGKVFHMPPERAQSASVLNATRARPPLQSPKPPIGSGPVVATSMARPTVTAPATMAPANMATAAPAKTPRIPMELQAVFLASQQGEVVDKPPSSGAAFRVFGSWFGRSSRNHNNSKGGAAVPRTLLPSMLQRRQHSARHQQDQPLQQPSSAPSLTQGKGGASRRIAQFFRSKHLRKQQSSSSFRRMPQLPEISEVSCSMDASVVDPTTHSIGGAGGDGELASIKEDVGRTRTPSSPLRRSFSVRSFGSSRRSSVGSAVSSSSAASSAASGNSSSAASPRLRKSGTEKNGSLCSQSCKSRTTVDSQASSHPVASSGSAVTDDDDNSSHSWDSGVSDLSSDDEALYADLEQMLSQAKAEFSSKKERATPAVRLPQDLKTQATSTSFAPTMPSFVQSNKQSSARPPSAQVSVYVPASLSPTRPRATPRPAGNASEPIIPVFNVASRQAKGQLAFEPTIPSFSENRIKKAPSATSFASSQVSRPTPALSSAPPTRTSPSSRIPLELQEIFLRSNAGENVEEILPPSNGNAFKVFARRSGSVWPSLLRRNPSRRPLLVSSKSKRQCSASKGGGHPKADQSVQSATGNTADMSSPLTASPIRAPKEIVYVPRIPEELQEIFVQSNRGEEVHQPPRSGAAFKVFEKRADNPHNLHHQPMTLNRLYMDWRVNNSAT